MSVFPTPFDRALDLLSQVKAIVNHERSALSGEDWLCAKNAQVAIEAAEYYLGAVKSARSPSVEAALFGGSDAIVEVVEPARSVRGSL